MFADVNAGVFVMVHGDATYNASSVLSFIYKMIDARLDMVVGCRLPPYSIAGYAYRRGHQLGNRMLTQSVMQIFGVAFADMLSAYRVFAGRYAKSFPVLSKGFGIEAGLTVRALELRVPYGEAMTPYGAHPEGAERKFQHIVTGGAYLDPSVGYIWLSAPLAFYSASVIIIAALSFCMVFSLIFEYFRTDLVPRFPATIFLAIDDGERNPVSRMWSHT